MNISQGSRSEALEARRLLTAGQLDPSFNAAVNNDYGAEFTAVQQDKTLVLARIYAPIDAQKPQGITQPLLFVTRLNSDGSLDASFGTHDPFRAASIRFKPLTAAGADAEDESPLGVATAPDGKIVVLSAADGDLSLTRLTTRGKLDRSFGAGGRVAVHLGASEMVIQSDGGIVVSAPTSNNRFTLVRFTDTGTLDPNFGTAGVASFAGGSGAQVEQLALGPNDSILAAGRNVNHQSLVVMKLGADGVPDAAFDDHGFASFSDPNSIDDLAASPDGGAYVGFGQQSGNTFDVLKLDAKGKPDVEYGPDASGRVAIALATGGGHFAPMFQGPLFVDHAGRLLIGGAAAVTPAGGPLLVRLGPDGSPDPNFGQFGRAILRAKYSGTVTQIHELPDSEIQADVNVDVYRYTAGRTRPLAIKLDHGTLIINGTTGDDRIVLGVQHKTLTAEINGSAQSFSLADVAALIVNGSAGVDWIDASSLSVPETLSGGDGSDTLVAGDGSDLLLGGRGLDDLIGNAGSDSLDGGGGANELNGGPGDDVADYSSENASRFDLAASGANLVISRNNGAAIDSLNDPDGFSLLGSTFDDTFTGHVALDVSINGSAGNDTFHTGPSKSSKARVAVSGGDGDDTFNVDSADSPASIFGDAGDDRVVSSTLQGFTDGGEGMDTEDFRSDTTVKPGTKITIGPEVQILYGPNIPSHLIGRAAADFNSETMFGGEGNDTIEGHASGLLSGGAGNDVLRAGGGGFTTLDGGPGADDIYGSDSHDDTVDYSGCSENLRITEDDIANDGAPGEHDNVHSNIEGILCGSGNDYVLGSQGDNDIFGGRGHDTLIGNGGRNTLHGDGSSDTLVGGGGYDIMWARDGNVDVIYNADEVRSADEKNGVFDIFKQGSLMA